MTGEERHLWYDFLKNLPQTVNRQKVIGNYIVDFYCSSNKLVIEIDGSQHYEDAGKKVDKERDEYLNKLGIKVLRYSNRDINQNFKKANIKPNLLEVDYLVALQKFKRENRKFDIIFLDPPYASGLYIPILKALNENGCLKPSTLIVCESDFDKMLENEPELKNIYQVRKASKYGKTIITVLEVVNNE